MDRNPEISSCGTPWEYGSRWNSRTCLPAWETDQHHRWTPSFSCREMNFYDSIKIVILSFSPFSRSYLKWSLLSSTRGGGKFLSLEGSVFSFHSIERLTAERQRLSHSRLKTAVATSYPPYITWAEGIAIVLTRLTLNEIGQPFVREQSVHRPIRRTLT